MEKSDTIRYREFIARLQTLVNESHLPPFVMIPVLREALQQLANQDERQYLEDMKKLSSTAPMTDAESEEGEKHDQHDV